MNRWIKHLICLTAVVLLCAVLAVAAFAVPAKPGTHEDTAALCRSHAGDLVTLDQLQKSSGTVRGAKSPVQPMTEKSLPLLVLVVGFNNIDYAPDFDWSNTIFEGEKSLSAYYTDMSFGNFTFVPAAETSAFDVDGNTNTADAADDGIVHLKLDIDHEDWTLDYSSQLLEDEMSLSLDHALIQAVQAAEPYVDFASYDKNEDGEITNNELALGLVFAGYEASETSRYLEGRDYFLWAHAWTLEDAAEEIGDDTEAPTIDGVLVSPYITMAERLSVTGEQAPISVLAHELGHYLGLPDLYNTESGLPRGTWKNYDVSYLSVMASGSWGLDEDDNYCPHSMDVWSRTVLGWCTPTLVDMSGDYAVNAQSYDLENETFSAVQVPTARPDEYYLLENRQDTKWDVNLSDSIYPCDQTTGIILWHVDMAQYARYEEDNEVNNSDHHPAVMPLYPEGNSEEYTFLGNKTKVNWKQPFFDKTYWETTYANLGAALDLPIYGAGADSDNRAARLASGIFVTFLNDSAPEMAVHVETPIHVHRLTFIERSVPDCIAGGVKEHWLCAGCNRSFADENAQTELTEEEITILPAEHVWNEGEVFLEPNYDDDGVKCYTCIVCGKVRYEQLPALERPEEPKQDENQDQNKDQQQGGQSLCPYCHQEHNGFAGFFIKIFHLILHIFKR